MFLQTLRCTLVVLGRLRVCAAVPIAPLNSSSEKPNSLGTLMIDATIDDICYNWAAKMAWAQRARDWNTSH